MEFSSSLTINKEGMPLLLEKRILLLQAIDELGSITQAAKRVPMSYKAAWDAIDAINNLSPHAVVTKETGGSGGGGARLTPYGANLVKSFLIVKHEHERFLERLSSMSDLEQGTLTSLQRIGMQISARNQIQGTILSITKGGVNSEIHIALKSTQIIVANITNASVETLHIKEGSEVVAIFKSSSVLLSLDENIAISARNKVIGTIERIETGAVNAEVLIDIGGGERIASVITANSIKELGFELGMRVCAIIKASDVMIGR